MLRGENLGAQHAALSAVRLVSYDTAADDFGIVVRGRCEFNGLREHRSVRGGMRIDAGVDEGVPAYNPNGARPVFDIQESAIEFELFVPRAGSALIAVGAVAIAATAFTPTRNVLDVWDTLPLDPDPTEYPSSGFTRDLMLVAPLLRPPFLHPAKLNSQGIV